MRPTGLSCFREQKVAGEPGRAAHARERAAKRSVASYQPFQPPEGTPSADKASKATGAGRRVLIVEDNPDARRLMHRLLQMWGYDTRVAEDGPSGVEAALAHRPVVALIDLGLPVLDGYEVARRIRAGSGGAAVRLVALTGYGELEDRDRAADAGFDLHLLKPVHPDRLLQALVELGGPSPPTPLADDAQSSTSPAPIAPPSA
jgi:CheY-like chemotaxis protein